MFNRYRIFAAYIFAIPLALLLGILSASPDEISITLIGLLLFFLALPLLLRWHHALLIFFWNSAFCAYFLVGQPNFWLLFVAMSFGISFLSYIMGRRPFLPVPEMNRPLLFLLAVVLGTAWYHGGIGVKALGGSSYGGRYYFYILGAIVGYYALTAGQIPVQQSRKMAGLYFLSGATFGLSNLAYTLGPAFYFVYYLVPSGLATGQAASDYGLTDIDRIVGLLPSCNAGFCFLLMYYGVRGLLDYSKPWRFVALCVVVGASLFAGFRSILVLYLLIFVLQLYFEGLLRTRLSLVVVLLVASGFVSVLFFSDKLPHVVQRAISYLPVKVDPDVQADATESTEWRFQMWAIVIKEVPRYLIIGKGYGIDPAELDLVTMGNELGMDPAPFEEQIIAGDYHNGPLSVLMPFGLVGMIGFIWVLVAGGRVLNWNFRYGDPRLRTINSALLSIYVANCIFFFFVFGALNSQLNIFLGAVGLSVSLNGGVKRKPKPESERDFHPLPQSYAMESE